jgi:hypothetical protein
MLSGKHGGDMYKTHAHRNDGIVDLTMYDGEPFSAIKEQARLKVESGAAFKTEVFDGNDKLVYHYPRVMRRA